MADDDRRVEPRERLVGRGIATTPERVQELRERQAALERASRKKPARPFAQVMATRNAVEPVEAVSDKEERRRKLPKKGPRPQLLHPAQRDAYGRDDDAEDDVIIKG